MNWLIWMLLFAVATTLFYQIYSEKYECVERKFVIEVGGCDRNGWCGVRYDDGTASELLKPLKGWNCTKFGRVKK